MTTQPQQQPFKVQNWADDLRLPCLVDIRDAASLLAAAEEHRKPPLPFQSKHLPALKRNVWYALRRPACRTRSGLLWLWPAQRCCVYIAADGAGPKRTPRVALLRLRVDPQFFASNAGPTVFAATLSAAARRLWLEDTLVWKGRALLETEDFGARWARARQWVEHYCVRDARLLGGLEVELAQWSPLNSVQPEGTWELQCNEPGNRRLLLIANHTESVQPSPALGPAPAGAATVPTLDILTGPLVAVATRAAGPDQWALAAADGTSLGRALIRTLAVSTELRASKTSTVRVEVEWRPDFNKWEIIGLTTDLAAHRSAFAAVEKPTPK